MVGRSEAQVASMSLEHSVRLSQCDLVAEAMLNGVMVALQILVLSVWVRVLVKQHIMGKIHSELVL